VFENLDSIEWHKLKHAYGSATDVPAQIRALVSDDVEIRGKALNKLYSNIYHQGSIYEAASYAIPFFIEILDSPESKDKAELLFYLDHLSHAGSYANSHKGFSFVYSAEKLASEEFKNQLNMELSWVKLSYDAVLKGQETYTQLMENSAEAVVQCRAINLLASFEELREVLLPRFVAKLKHETDLDVQTAIINVLWKFPVVNEQETIDLLMNCLKDEDAIIRLVTAQTFARIYRENTPQDVIDILVEALTPDANLDGRYWNLIWTSSTRIFPTILEALCFINRESSRTLLPRILNIIKTIGLSWLSSIFLMILLFGGEKFPEGGTVKDLDELQLRALRMIDGYAKALGKGFHYELSQIGRNLRRYGLPYRPADLDTFLKG
jgi:hypothetical protein